MGGIGWDGCGERERRAVENGGSWGQEAFMGGKAEDGIKVCRCCIYDACSYGP